MSVEVQGKTQKSPLQEQNAVNKGSGKKHGECQGFDNIFETSGNAVVPGQTRQGPQNPYKCSPKLDIKVLNELSNGSMHFSTNSNINKEQIIDLLEDQLSNETEDLYFHTEIEPKKLLKLRLKEKRRLDDSFGDVSESHSQVTQINHPYISQQKKNQNEKKYSSNHQDKPQQFYLDSLQFLSPKVTLDNTIMDPATYSVISDNAFAHSFDHSALLHPSVS